MTKAVQTSGTHLRAVSTALALAMVLVPPVAAQGQTYKVLWAFSPGQDGAEPAAGLVRDAAGNLYGTTAFGGASDLGNSVQAG